MERWTEAKQSGNKISSWLLLCLLIPLLYFPLFAHLDEVPLIEWDEARLAVNAYEMSQSGDLVVTTYNDLPEMWNTKPPLMIWLQALCIKIIGPSVFAIRLPSALAAIGTCLLLFWFLAKKQQKPVLGFITCLILVTSQGYVSIHGTRTGDYDSLLTFFSISFLLFWFLYLEEAKHKYFYFFIASLIAAVLTKGVQPMMFLPAILLYTAINGKLLAILKRKELYAGIGMFVLCIGGYYLLREHYNPRYLDAVIKNELAGRYAEVKEQHTGTPWYYFDHLLNKEFRPWIYFVPLGVIFGFASKNRSLQWITAYAFLCSLFYLTVLSFSASKLFWYEIPAIPLLSIISAIFFYSLFTILAHFKVHIALRGLFVVALIIVSAPVYLTMLDSVMNGKYPDDSETRKMAEYMHLTLKGGHDIAGHQMAFTKLDQNIFWYQHVMEKDRGVRLREINQLQPGVPALIYQQQAHEYIQNYYEHSILKDYGTVKIYHIVRHK